MLYLDVKYLRFVSGRLEGFVDKGNNLFNCRCPICGDSAKSETLKRFFAYAMDNKLMVKCHNCDYCLPFSAFLENFDPLLYREYLLEVFREKYGGNTTAPTTKKLDEEEPPPLPVANHSVMSRLMALGGGGANKPHSTPAPQPPIETVEEIFERICSRVSELPLDHLAKQYCINRKIPRFQLNRLWFINDTRMFAMLNPDIVIKFGESRLVIPFYDRDNKLIGLTARSLNKASKLRYMNVKLSDKPQVFGLEKLNPRADRIFVVEGPIDSLFLPNCIAVTGTSFGKIDEISKTLGIPKEKMTLVVDNQPRNKEVCAVIEKLVQRDYKVVLWSISPEYGKDINAMITDGGMTPKEVFDEITTSTYSGLMARLKFSEWKKC